MTALPSSPLLAKMRELIAAGHEKADELLAAADAFELAIAQLTRNEISVPKFLSVWARARRTYTESTGKDLMES